MDKIWGMWMFIVLCRCLLPSLKPTVPASAETASAIITEEQLDSRMLSNGNLETVCTNSNRTLYQKMYAKFPAFLTGLMIISTLPWVLVWFYWL